MAQQKEKNQEGMRHLAYFNSRDRLIRVDLRQVIFFESYGNYSSMFTTDGQRAYLNISLTQVETVIRTKFAALSNVFLRIGKRYVVNCNYVYQIDLTKQCLLLSDMSRTCVRLQISKNALTQVKKLLIEHNV